MGMAIWNSPSASAPANPKTMIRYITPMPPVIAPVGADVRRLQRELVYRL